MTNELEELQSLGKALKVFAKISKLLDSLNEENRKKVIAAINILYTD